jgi:hypothetical protein
MTVADLIHLLAQMDPNAVVVLADHSASDQPAVYKLGAGEVRAIELGGKDCGGLWLVEPWHIDKPWRRHSSRPLEGPFSGVVLGELDA